MLPVLRAGQHCLGDVVATVRRRAGIAGAGVDPLDRSSELPGDPEHQRPVREDVALRSEAAPDRGGDDPHLVVRDAEHVQRREQPYRVERLDVGVKREVARRLVIVGDVATRLDGVGDEALVADRLPHHDLRLRDGGVGGVPVADRGAEHQIAGHRFVQLGRSFGQCGLHLGDRGQHLVVDGDELQRIVGLLPRVGDDHRHRVSGEADPVGREHGHRAGNDSGGMRGEVALDVRGNPDHREGHDLRDVGTGEDSDDPGRRARCRRVDGCDPGVAMRASQDRRVHHPREPDVGDELGLTSKHGGGLGGGHTGADQLAVVLAVFLAVVLLRSGLVALEPARRRVNRAHQVVVAGHAAEVAVQPGPDLRRRGIGISREQVGHGHHHARGGESVLGCVLLPESLLDRRQLPFLCEPLDGRDPRSAGRGGQHQAALDGLAVEEDGAGAALAGLAADLCPGELQPVPQGVDQELPGRDVNGHLRAVDG